MNDRQRFHATMHYQPRDRAPLCDFGFWDETLVLWREQGLPAHVNASNADVFSGMDFGVDRVTGASGINVGLAPSFEEKVLEDRGDHEVVQQGDGVRVLRKKFMGSIPQHLGHLLVDRDSWRKHYLPRLDPTQPDRYPADWEERIKIWTDPHRAQVIALPGGSLYGWIRDWMGVEKVSLTVYDDRAWFEEMVTTVADCVIGVLSRALERGGQFDACFMWEGCAQVCCDFSALISPAMFRRWVMPALEEEASIVKHAFYHWDGPRALVHANDLLASKGLHTFGFVPDPGYKHSDCLDLLKRIQAAGKAVQFIGTVDEIKMAHKELKPDKVAYWTTVEKPSQIESLLEWFRKNT